MKGQERQFAAPHRAMVGGLTSAGQLQCAVRRGVARAADVPDGGMSALRLVLDTSYSPDRVPRCGGDRRGRAAPDDVE